MIINTKVIAELIMELKDINKSLYDVNREIQDLGSRLLQIQESYLGSLTIYREITQLLQNTQKLIDYQMGKHAQDRQQSLKLLKEELQQAGQLLGPGTAGTRFNTKVITAFNEPIYVKDYLAMIAERTVYGVASKIRHYDRAGARENLSYTTLQDLNEGYDQEITGAAQQLRIVSTSSADSAGGQGIERVFVSGIGNSGLRTAETVTLQGNAPVTTSNTYAKIDWFGNIKGGSYGAVAAGNISCTDLSGVVAYAGISQGGDRWKSGKFLVDSTQECYLHTWSISAMDIPVQFELWLSVNDINTVYNRGTLVAKENSQQFIFPSPLVVAKNGRILIKGKGRTNGAIGFTDFLVHVEPGPDQE